MKKLWTEKYRPNTLDGYVFQDSTQRKQIERWISDGDIPHLILSGTQGIGKCLDYTEEVEVYIDEASLTPEQLKILEKYRKLGNNIERETDKKEKFDKIKKLKDEVNSDE